MAKIRNRTSSVPVVQTIAKIETLLVLMGATDIMKSYQDKELTGISFRVVRHNQTFPFRLPVKVKDYARVMFTQEYDKLTTVKQEQAQRTAWKCIQEWVELQYNMIEMKQADPVEIFLPYYWTDQNTTLYDKLQQTNFRLLTT